MTEIAESVFLEVYVFFFRRKTIDNSKQLVFVAFIPHKSNTNAFLDVLEHMIDKVVTDKIYLTLMGDYIINNLH